MSSAVSALPTWHRMWRLLPARQRRAALAWGTASLAGHARWPVPPTGGGEVILAGEFDRASGIAEGARLTRAALGVLGIACLEPHADGATTRVPTPAAGVPLIMHVNSPTLPLALLRLGRRWTARRRLIGFWNWELQSIPADWRAGAACVHEAWTPSRFTAEALETLLPGRVRVVPYAVAASPPLPAALGREAFGLPADALVVLVSFNLASSFERKNPLGAIAAFRAAFGDRPDRLLVLKVTHVDHAPADFVRLREAATGSANIRFETRIMPVADSHALTAASDIVLSLHRSEGFGLVPAEAMLLGRPVIATGWSGNMDFMDETCAALVGVDLVAARDPRLVYEVPGAVWAEPRIGEAVTHLRRLADDEGARTDLGTRGRAAAEARLGTAGLDAALRAIGLVSGGPRPDVPPP